MLLMEGNPTESRESSKTHQITFGSLDEAVRFLKDFWNAVDPGPRGVGEQVAHRSPETFIGERTRGRDRAILQETGSGNYTLHVYGNNNDNQLSEKALVFLKSRSVI